VLFAETLASDTTVQVSIAFLAMLGGVVANGALAWATMRRNTERINDLAVTQREIVTWKTEQIAVRKYRDRRSRSSDLDETTPARRL